MYNRMFDLDQDGKLDAAEMALEYMNFRAVTGEYDSDDDDQNYEDGDFDEDQIGIKNQIYQEVGPYMGEYFDWVNVNKREHISPGDFDYGNKFHESLHKNNPFLRALYELLSGRWKGDPVVFLGDEAKIPKDTTYGLLHDLLGQAGTEHYYDFVCENYRNVSCLFRDVKRKYAKESTTTYMTSKTEAHLLVLKKLSF